MAEAGGLQEDISDAAPLGGTRAEAVQRLQVGLSGIAAMVLLVGLANVIQNRARETEELAVPGAAPTTEPTEAPQQRDPLADAGVVPDLPVENTSPALQSAAGTDEQGVRNDEANGPDQAP